MSQWDLALTDARVATMQSADDGYGITDKCKEYLYPLIKGEAYPDYDENGMPVYVTMKNELVAQKLEEFDL